MTDKNIPVEDILEERYCLAAERVKELTQEKDVPEPFRSFFAEMAEFLEKILTSVFQAFHLPDLVPMSVPECSEPIQNKRQ